MRSGGLDEGEAFLVLDILELHALGAPDEDGVRVRGVDDVVHLDPRLARLREVLVGSAEEHRQEAEDAGIEVADFVDAANTIAVFVWGPERVKIEYVEHKPTFALR